MATALTAPVVPAAFFADPAKIFGIAAGAGDVLIGTSGGGLATVSAAGAAAGAMLYFAGAAGTSPAISADPTVGGTLTAVGLTATSGVTGATVSATTTITAGTNITATLGNITATAGNVAAGAAVTAGTSVSATTSVTAGTNVVATSGDITATAGNVAAGGTVTGATGVIATANGLQAGGLTVGSAAGTISGASAVVISSGGGGNVTLNAGAGNVVLTAAAPSAANHAATKSYVDSVATGLDLKASSRLKTVTGLPAYSWATNVFTASANGALSVDGTAVAAGDRVLVDQLGTATGSDPEHAGIYVVTDAGDGSNPFVLTRASDADSSAEVTSGMYTFVTEGSSAGDKGYVLTTNDPITLNTTALSFTQFSATAAATPAGSSGDVQYNSGGAFAADTGAFTYTGSGSTGVLKTQALKSASGYLGLASAGASDAGARAIVGDMTNQGSVGSSFAFGDASSVSAADGIALGHTAVSSAARAVALGKDATARVVDTLAAPLIPIGARATGTSIGAGGAAATLATAMSALSTVEFSCNGDHSDTVQLAVPAGTKFFPLGALSWCSKFTRDGGAGAQVGAFTVTVGSTSGGSDVASIAFSQPTAVGQSRLQWSTSTNRGLTSADTISISVDETVASPDTYNQRLSLFGYLVEKESVES